MKSFSFHPIENNDAKILILGSMPGKTSLEFNEYYAYKHNTFWRIIFDLFDMKHTNNYNRKTNLLTNNKIALWDTLKFCERKGSLDSNIKNEILNNFDIFFRKHNKITDIIFNETASSKYYKKYVGFNNQLNFHILPSTSPANAGKRYQDKLAEWKIILTILEDRS